jgi:hypothetical protein
MRPVYVSDPTTSRFFDHDNSPHASEYRVMIECFFNLSQVRNNESVSLLRLPSFHFGFQKRKRGYNRSDQPCPNGQLRSTARYALILIKAR